MVGKKLYIEMGVVMVLGMMCLSMPTMPSVVASTPDSASSALALTLPCWDRIGRCMNSTFNETTLLELFEPSLNMSRVLCCTAIQKEVQAEKDCFCRGAKIVAGIDDSHSSNFNEILSTCNVTSPLNALCSAASGRQVGWAILLSLLFVVFTTFTF